jgi:PAS domain S-box-containing protein
MDNLSKIKNLLKKDQRGLNIREISEKLDINRNSIAKLLEILTAKEEVEFRAHGRSKIYYLAKPQDYRKWFELLSRTVDELNNFPPDGDLYAFIAGTLKHIAPEDTIIFVNSFDLDTKTITCNAVEGLGSRQPDIEAILCRPLKGLAFSVPDRILPEMLTGECNEIPGGLTDLTFGGLPYETCKKIEEMPFFGKVYSAGISWNGRLNGAITFILPQGAELENHDLITFFIRQVAGFLSRRDAEAALKESDQFRKEIIHNSKEGIVVYDRNFNYLVWNPFMESLTGFSASETLGKNGLDLFPHLREQLVNSLLQRALAGETVRSPDIPYHVPQTKKSGWVSGIYSPHLNGHGEIIGVIGNIRDITKRKRAEDALKESEIRYRTIFENTGTAIVIVEEDTTVGFANNEFFRLTGYSQEDIDSRKSWTEFVHKEDLNRMIEQHKLRRVGSSDVLRQYEFRLLTKSGEIRNILLTIEMVPDTKKSIASLIDITERIRAEENLQTSRLLMQSVFDAVPDLLIVIDRNYNIMYTNAKGHDLILQGDPEKRKTCYGRFKLLDDPCEICSSRPVFETGKMSEQEMINPADGRIREVRAFPITDPHGLVSYVIEYVRDITDRKRIEEALRESEEKYRIVAEGASDGIAILLDGRLEYVNPSLAHMAGYSVEELTGASFIRFFPPESIVDLLDVVKKAFSGEPVPAIFQTRIRHHDGHIFEIEASGIAITWKGKKALLGFIRNMSGRTKTEKRGPESLWGGGRGIRDVEDRA